MRVWLAVLFVAAVLIAAVVGPADSRVRTRPAGTAAPLAPSTTLPPPSSVPSTTSTTATAPTNPVTTLPPAPPPPANSARVLVSKTGVILPIQAQLASGWKVETPCSKTLVLNQGTPKGPVQVVLDPGHGGTEPGAQGPNGLTESVLNMAVARDTKAALEKAGITVLLTRTADYRMTLQARADVAMAIHPNVFLSIHHNAEPDGPFPKPGTETYYQIANPDSKRLAGLVYEEVVKALGQYHVAWVADTDAGAKYRPNDTGDDYYGVLRRTHGITAALAELSFISDPPEADLLVRPDVQQVEGEAVARGIIRYLTTKDPGSGFTIPYPRTEPAGGGGGATNCVDPAL